MGLHQRDRYSTMSGEELDIKVQELQKKFPNAGCVMMCGLLKTKGILVQKKRIRDSISRVCPVPVAQRLGTTVSRRQYQVHMSNSLWHVDGHMKLARWGISTHGCIDGYSRLVVFLKADINNKAKTVLQHFVNACEQYGIPSRVRSDYGKENIMVSMFINMVNGQDRHSHITGRSVHNQRIERLWRDVHSQVTQQYYNKFYRMEDQGLLDPENKYHLLAVHYTFLQDINAQLETFRAAWNDHKLSSENNLCPHQLWINGILKNVNSSCMAIRNLYGPSLSQIIEDCISKYEIEPNLNIERDVEENALTGAQEEELKNRLDGAATPEQRFQYCLNYFDEVQIL